jgi:drug/metabolite transporter (DMT)-like permease
LTRSRALEAALIGVTAIWGVTFPMVKSAVEQVPVYSFNGVRFLLAAAVLALVSHRGLARLGRAGWWHGGVLGGFLFAGYAFQTVGLQHTTASRAGFITGTSVVLVPVLATALLRRRPTAPAVLGVVLATSGLALLSLSGSGGDGSATLYGDGLVLLCAVSFAAHIVGLGAWSRRHEALPLTTVQLLAAGLLHGAVALPLEAPAQPYSWSAEVLVALLVTGLLASAAAFWIQTAAQKVVSPTRTAIIFTMEPVFAGLFGYLLLGEVLTGAGWLGSGLILAGMLVAELLAPVTEVPVTSPSSRPSGGPSPGARPERLPRAHPDP